MEIVIENAANIRQHGVYIGTYMFSVGWQGLCRKTCKLHICGVFLKMLYKLSNWPQTYLLLEAGQPETTQQTKPNDSERQFLHLNLAEVSKEWKTRGVKTDPVRMEA